MTDAQPSRQLTEEEWVVLLDVYQTCKKERMSASHPAILSASETLRALAKQGGRTVDPGFRPPSGIHRQIGIFRSLDSPRTNEKVPKLAEAVWLKLSSDPAGCRRLADAIRSKVHESDSGR